MCAIAVGLTACLCVAALRAEEPGITSAELRSRWCSRPGDCVGGARPR
jgi:hypothetical protein